MCGWYWWRYFLAGEDLLSIGADQPFRFPATFTFLVRAFSGESDGNRSSMLVNDVVCPRMVAIRSCVWCPMSTQSDLWECFAVLDGIGKGLDPRFDISEIAKPWVVCAYPHLYCIFLVSHSFCVKYYFVGAFSVSSGSLLFKIIQLYFHFRLFCCAKTGEWNVGCG